jgi:hypothetical protein
VVQRNKDKKTAGVQQRAVIFNDTDQADLEYGEEN